MVELLQRALNDANVTPQLTVDGDFGLRTEAAVRQFQASHLDEAGVPLDVDGVVGANTWQALGVEPSTNDLLCRPHIPGLVARKIVRIATAEALCGVKEQGANTGVDVKKYQAATALPGTGWPWCAAFVTWVYEAAGLQLRDAGGFASVSAMQSWAERTGRWFPKHKDYFAPAGSIVIFTFSHTGIVVQSYAGYDTTIEGNTSSGIRGSQRDGDGVYQRTRSHKLVGGYVVLDEILAPVDQDHTPADEDEMMMTPANSCE